MTSWTVTYDSTQITIPRLPERIEVRKSADVTTLTLPGDEPLLMSMGIGGRTLAVVGTLYGDELSVLNSLMSAVYKTVTISGLGTNYNGSYILKEVSWSHQVPNVYGYSLQFEKGSEMISL
jgi:hypothetical protein